jgi:hypothetical protein
MNRNVTAALFLLFAAISVRAQQGPSMKASALSTDTRAVTSL